MYRNDSRYRVVKMKIETNKSRKSFKTVIPGLHLTGIVDIVLEIVARSVIVDRMISTVALTGAAGVDQT